jgi:hypothetical protein
MVYNGFLSSSKRPKSLLMDVAIRCLRSLYERDCRRSFCEPELWLAPAKGQPPPTAAAARAHEVATALEKMGDTSQAPALGAILTTIPHVLPFDERHPLATFLFSLCPERNCKLNWQPSRCLLLHCLLFLCFFLFYLFTGMFLVVKYV